MTAFPATLDEAAARAAFSAPFARRLAVLLRTTRLVRLERVWLPFALVEAISTTRNATSRLHCLVDRIEGSAFGLRDPERQPVKTVFTPSFPAQLPLEECVPLAELFFRRRLLLTRTGANLEMNTSNECHYPFWVAYWERRRGSLDVRLIDAVTGQVAGTGLRRAFLAGLQARTSPVDAD